MNTNAPKNFVMQLGSLIALYVSITSLLLLIFSVTNLRFPDEAAYYFEDESARQTVRIGIAMLAVFFPAYLIFTRLSNQQRRKENNGEYITLAKWLVYLSILGGVLILLADLVTLIQYFLNGEITARFLVKVTTLLLVVGVTLFYYVLDVRGYFTKRVGTAMYFAAGATVLVVASLLYGYAYIETPAEVREMRFDEQQVTDLQDIYWHIEEYYAVTQTLPVTVSEMYTNQPIPQAPSNREEYAYNILTDTTYELCATFEFASQDIGRTQVQPVLIPEEKVLYQNQNWSHGEGETCFVRVVQKQIK